MLNVILHKPGYDDCDVPEMTKRGICLCNSTIPTGTSDICIFLILAVFRNTFAGQRQIMNGGFREYLKMDDLGNVRMIALLLVIF